MLIEGLLPCPFCGGEASDAGHVRYSRPLTDTWWSDGSPITETFLTHCRQCGSAPRANGLVMGYQTKAEAFTAWNTRATPPASSNDEGLVSPAEWAAAWLAAAIERGNWKMDEADWDSAKECLDDLNKALARHREGRDGE